jgi:hypothetical protein
MAKKTKKAVLPPISLPMPLPPDKQCPEYGSDPEVRKAKRTNG